MVGDRVRALGRRSFHVELQPYRDRTDYVIRRRTRRGGERADQVLAVGTLNYSTAIDQPRDLIRDLRRIADVLERRYQSTRREAPSEPPDGGYGGDLHLPGMQSDDWAFSRSGLPMDYS